MNTFQPFLPFSRGESGSISPHIFFHCSTESRLVFFRMEIKPGEKIIEGMAYVAKPTFYGLKDVLTWGHQILFPLLLISFWA